jgi:hypothetical protein
VVAPDHDERRQRRVPDLRAHTTGGGETGRNERWSNWDHRSGLGSGGGDRRREIRRRRRWRRAGKRRRAHDSLLSGGCGFFLFSRCLGTKTSGRQGRVGRPDGSISVILLPQTLASPTATASRAGLPPCSLWRGRMRPFNSFLYLSCGPARAGSGSRWA